MRPEAFASSLGALLERTPAFPGETLAVDLIANPRAGGFTRPSFARRRERELEELHRRAAGLPRREAPFALALHETEGPKDGARIMGEILAEAKGDRPGTRRLVMTASGDGTALEVAEVLVGLSPEERERFALHRLPLGTGNDGSEGRDLVASLERFLGPLGLAPRRALRVVPNPEGGSGPLYAFNIASLGLDAYVCDMTNRLKARFPGDSYKLWLDVASILYDRIWPTKPLRVSAFAEDGSPLGSFERECLLLAMGVSGRRRYGSNKPILPDDDNACAVFQMPFLRKLAVKGPIASGRHRGLPEATLFSAHRLVIESPTGILLQRDGEVDELGAEDFPLAFELTEPLYNGLEAL